GPSLGTCAQWGVRIWHGECGNLLIWQRNVGRMRQRRRKCFNGTCGDTGDCGASGSSVYIEPHRPEAHRGPVQLEAESDQSGIVEPGGSDGYAGSLPSRFFEYDQRIKLQSLDL